MVLLFLLVAISIGVFLSVYAKYCMHYFFVGEHKALRWVLATSLYAVVLLAVLASDYILSLPVFRLLNGMPGRIAFVLIWLVPFGTTVMIQIANRRREASK